MADQATRGKQPAKERRPSLLRHEIRPDSTDDNRDSQGDIVQAPHSDTIVFDTQLDTYNHAIEHMDSKDPKHDFADPPLSPNSRVTLERFVATKKTSIPVSDTITVKTFSKELVELGGGLALPPKSFSYGRAVRTASETSAKTGPVEPQPTVHTTSPSSKNQEMGDQEIHAGVALATTAHRASPEVPVNVPHARKVTHEKEPNFSISPAQSLAADDYPKPTSHPCSLQSKTTPLFPLPTQASSKRKNETKKGTGFGKYRKSRKTLPNQQHVRPWPPRGNDASNDAQPLTDVHPVKLEKRDDQPKDLTRDDAMLPVASHDSSKPTAGYQVHKLNVQNAIKAEHGTEAYSATEEVSHKTSPRTLDTLAPQPVSASSLPPAPAANRQCSVTNLGQEDLKEDHEEASRCSHESDKSNNQAMVPPSESRNDPLLCTSGSGDDLRIPQPPFCVDGNPQPPTAPLIASPEVLHRMSNRGVPSRIVKPRMKSRTDSKPTSNGHQGASMPPVVDRALKNLEMAFLAESFRKTHEHSTELEHAAEKATLHLQTIDFQKEMIADLRKQRDELNMSFDSITRKTKTNQKFLEGFQKDYEKLKRLTTTFQEDNKKILQAKIAEVEEEKHTLRRELEMATGKLAESQRKVRAVADELYVKLAITLSENESLTNRLNGLEEAYKSEKKKREDAESELLNEVHNLQRQFSNTSNTLVNKLEQFHTSVENTVISDHQDTNIQQCLDILNSLKTAPLVKVQDVRKAEEMLCFVRTRVESGLEDLRKTIASSGSSNADLHASINEQLQDLRTNVMRYEQLATENCRIKETNFALTQQLESQRQECAHFNEKVEHLKQVEIDLKDRSSKLERDLGSMKTATHSSRLEMSAVEQMNNDLRQQLKQVESELVATKAKADGAEESRKNLEMQAAEYKTRYEATTKEQMTEKRNAATTCEKLSEEFKLKLSEKQQELQSEIYRFKVDLQEKEAAYQKLSEDLSIANAHLDKLRQRADGQEDTNNKLKAYVSQQETAMKVMRQEADESASQKQQEAQRMLELVQNKVSLLENEKHTLLSELSRAREDEHKMKRVEEAVSAENDRLNQEIRNIRSVIDTKDAEIAQIRSECVNEHQKVIEQYRNDVENYKCRLAETSTSLKEVEANAKLLEDHYQARIVADQKIAESKLLELEKEYRNALVPIEWQGNHETRPSPSVSQSGQRLPTAKGRKRVERDNRSIIEATQEQNHSLDLPTLPHTEDSQPQSEDQDLFAAFIDDVDNSLQGRANGDSMANHEYSSVRTFQDLDALPFSQAFFTEKHVEAATKEPPNRDLSSSGFSSVTSDELARMQKEVEFTLTSRSHARNIGSRDNEKTGVSHIDNASVTSSHSSQSKERPRSQANTSSRMMPSRGSVSPDKRKLSASQTDSDLTSKRQCGTSFSQPAFSSSGLRRRSPRLSRQRVGGSGLSESDRSHTKGDLSKASHPRSQGRSSEIQRDSSNYMSSDKTHLSRQQPSHTHTTPSKRHYSRITRNQSRNGTAFEDEFNDRFNEELQGLD